MHDLHILANYFAVVQLYCCTRMEEVLLSSIKGVHNGRFSIVSLTTRCRLCPIFIIETLPLL
jgi:hypothetical protein